MFVGSNMVPINQNYVVWVVSVVVLLFCYYLFRETKRTQQDVQGLQTFSAKMMQLMEKPQQGIHVVATAPKEVKFANPPVVDEDEVIDTTEGKKED